MENSYIEYPTPDTMYHKLNEPAAVVQHKQIVYINKPTQTAIVNPTFIETNAYLDDPTPDI